MGKDMEYNWNGNYASQKEEMMLADRDVEENLEDDPQKRPSWTRSIDFFVACVGGSVGLGNVWRFPYLCYKNGGGAFLIPYFLAVLFASLPLVVLEVAVGQYMSMAGHKAWGILPLLQGLGMSVTIIIFYCNCYYNIVMAWSVMYLFHSFSAHLPWDSCDGSWNTDQCSTDFHKANKTVNNIMNNANSTATTNNTSLGSNKTSPLVDPVTEFWENKVLGLSSGIGDMGYPKWDLVLCLLFAWVLVYLCICKGIKSSGKVMYFTAPAPYVFMLVILIRNATLEGSADGVSYYLRPNITKLGEYTVWAEAARQTFFSSSIGFGVMITLGSYNKFNHNLCRDSILYAIVNSMTSLFAGFLVFTILGVMALQQGLPIEEVAESGPGLAFIAYPKAVAQMPLPQLWSVCFFIMIILLGLDTQFIGVEAVITHFIDLFPTTLRRGYRKEMFSAFACLVMFLVGLVCTCNGGMYVLQMFDFYTGGLTLFVMGFIEVFGMTYLYGIRRFYDNMVMMVGSHWMKCMYPYLALCWMFVTPIMCFFLVLLGCINHQELTYKRPNESVYHYPSWANTIGWGMTVTTVIWIPVVAIYRFLKFGFSRKVLRMMLVPYKLEKHQRRPQDIQEPCLHDLEQDTAV